MTTSTPNNVSATLYSFPRIITVGSPATLAQVEGLIVRLSHCREIPTSARDELMITYKETRMDYLDATPVDPEAWRRAHEIYRTFALAAEDKLAMVREVTGKRLLDSEFTTGEYVDGLMDCEIDLLDAIFDESIYMRRPWNIFEKGSMAAFENFKQYCRAARRDMLLVTAYDLDIHL